MGCQDNPRERKDLKLKPPTRLSRSASGNTPAGVGAQADQPVKPESREGGRLAEWVSERGGGSAPRSEGQGGGESCA